MSCESGVDITNLAISEKVDLYITGHEHNYERSKQLALNGSTCTAIQLGAYNSACVVSSTNPFIKGAGTIILTIGTGGEGSYPCGTSTTNSGGYIPQYFLQCSSASFGFVKFDVTGTSLGASFVASTGTYSDSFNIADFSVSASPGSVSIQQGYSAVSQIIVTSLNGFGGTVALTATPSVNVCGFTVVWSGQNWNGCSSSNIAATTVSVASGGSTSIQLNIGVCLSTPPGAYSVSVSGASGGVSHATTIAVQVLSGPGCDSGSVAAGTLISLANGSQVRVENLRSGMLLLSYNVTANRFAASTITMMQNVPTDDKLLIQTEDGPSLVTDNATIQKLWVRQGNGNTGWLSVTQIRVGDCLYQPLEQEWTRVDRLDLTQGSYTMYDIYDTAPGNYIANGYLDPTKR